MNTIEFQNMMLKAWDVVADANAWYEEDDSRPVIGKCAECGEDIRGEYSRWLAEPHYDLSGLNGDLVCEGCWRGYGKRFLKGAY